MRERERIQIVHIQDNSCHAGAKAPNDAVLIAEKMGFRRFFVRRKVSSTACVQLFEKVSWIIKMFWYCLRMPRRAIIFIQSNSELFTGRLGFRLVVMWRKWRSANVILLVHDIDFLRGACSHEDKNKLSNSMLGLVGISDVLIVHNAAMRTYLENAGVSADKLVEIGLFDYLAAEPVSQAQDKFNEVVIAGNLSFEKTAYLSRLGEVLGVHWNLFGPNFDRTQIQADNIAFCGCFHPDELPRHLKGAFGLVWDGVSVDTCAGNYGEYLRYNNPHKTSMYLSCGIPVIIWRHAALADLIVQEGVGLVIDSLCELPNILNQLSSDKYQQFVANAKQIGNRLRTGYYLSRALNMAISCIER